MVHGKEEAERRIAPITAILAGCYMKALDTLTQSKQALGSAGNRMSARTESSIISDEMMHHVSMDFISFPGAYTRIAHGRVTLYYDGFSILFKRLSKNRRPLYTRTKKAVQNFEQQTPDMFPEMPALTSTVAGYVPDGFGGIAEMVFCCPLGRRNVWEIGFDFGGESEGNEPVPITPPDEPKAPTLRIRRSDATPPEKKEKTGS